MELGSLLDWDSLDSNQLNTIILLICCPRYQFSPDDRETDSDVNISYIYIST
jgi:hypothetical protein